MTACISSPTVSSPFSLQKLQNRSDLSSLSPFSFLAHLPVSISNLCDAIRNEVSALLYLLDFTIDRSNPHATTPPQAMRTITIFHELRVARQRKIHRCVRLVDAVTSVG